MCVHGTGGTKASPKPLRVAPSPWLVFPCYLGLLVPLQQAAGAVGPLERKAVAVGSSVLLPGPDNVTQISSTRWEYLNGTSSCTILQHYRGSRNPAIHEPYAGRAAFHPSNGSLLLEDVQESDSGIYKVTINVGDGESLKILLEVLSKCWEERGEGCKQTSAVISLYMDHQPDKEIWRRELSYI